MLMGKLTTNEVLHVARLAKLELSSLEVKKFQDQLSKIISYVDELDQVKTEDVEPTSQTTGLSNVTREDKIVVDDCLSQKEALSGASRAHNGYFVVDAILEKDREK